MQSRIVKSTNILKLTSKYRSFDLMAILLIKPAGHWSEYAGIPRFTRLRQPLYAEIRRHFSSTFLPLLVANSLVGQLPIELANNTLITEIDSDCFVIHAGSIKLVLRVRQGLQGGNSLSVQLYSDQDQDTIGMSFFHSRQGLDVEYTMYTPLDGVYRFLVKLPDTTNHPLNVMLARLYPAVYNAFKKPHLKKGGLDKIASILKYFLKSKLKNLS